MRVRQSQLWTVRKWSTKHKGEYNILDFELPQFSKEDGHFLAIKHFIEQNFQKDLIGIFKCSDIPEHKNIKLDRDTGLFKIVNSPKDSKQFNYIVSICGLTITEHLRVFNPKYKKIIYDIKQYEKNVFILNNTEMVEEIEYKPNFKMFKNKENKSLLILKSKDFNKIEDKFKKHIK